MEDKTDGLLDVLESTRFVYNTVNCVLLHNPDLNAFPTVHFDDDRLILVGVDDGRFVIRDDIYKGDFQRRKHFDILIDCLP